jgi:hypothetical protein
MVLSGAWNKVFVLTRREDGDLPLSVGLVREYLLFQKKFIGTLRFVVLSCK